MSKGLEIIHRFQTDDIRNIEEYSIIEKELKALEIIKRKLCFEIKNGALTSPMFANWFPLTQEEYELLKEVFPNE